MDYLGADPRRPRRPATAPAGLPLGRRGGAAPTGPREDDPSWAGGLALRAGRATTTTLMRPRLRALRRLHLREAGGPPVESRAGGGHQRGARARPGRPRRTRLDRQEHEPHRARRRLLLLHRHRAHDRRARRPTSARRRPLRHLHRVPGRLSHRARSSRRTCSTRAAAWRT